MAIYSYNTITAELERVNLSISSKKMLLERAKLVQGGSIGFRIARIFDNFLFLFPRQLEDWYLRQIQTLDNSRILEIKFQDPTLRIIERFKHSARFETIFFENTIDEEELEELRKSCHYLQQLENLKKTFEDVIDLSLIDQYIQVLIYQKERINRHYESSLKHLLNVCNELKQGNYDQYTMHEILKIALKMTFPCPSLETIRAQKSREGIYQQYKKGELWQVDSKFLMNSKMETVAKIRKKNLEEDNRCLGFEFDDALGSNGVTPTQIIGSDVIEELIPSAVTLNHFLENETVGDIEKSFNVFSLHSFLIQAMIKGRKNGNGYNILVQKAKDDAKLYDINETHYFQPNLKIGEIGDETIDVRISALGLPQAAIKIPKIILKLFSWEGLKQKAVQFLESRNELSYINDIADRIEKITEACGFESSKKESNLSPRDLFFFVFGKEYLFASYKQKAYTDYQIFERPISYDDFSSQDPEQGIMILPKTQNLKALDRPFDISYFKSPDEALPGQTQVTKVYFDLIEKGQSQIEINSKDFDREAYSSYIDFCNDADKQTQKFMSSYFFSGLAKRLSRQFSVNSPLTHQSVKLEGNKTYLLFKHDIALLQANEQVQALETGRVSLAILTRVNFNPALYAKYKKETGSVILKEESLNCLSGKAYAIAKWMLHSHISLNSKHWLSIEFLQENKSFNLFYNKRK